MVQQLSDESLNMHKDYCCNNETMVEHRPHAREQSLIFDSNGFCVECGITESGKDTEYSKTEFKIHAELKALLISLRMNKFERNGQVNYLQGTFQNLLSPATFHEVLFPGTPTKLRQDLPKDLFTLLKWEPMYTQITDSLPRISKATAVILGNVKMKGIARGDVMDDAVESVLLPQIVQGMHIRHTSSPPWLTHT